MGPTDCEPLGDSLPDHEPDAAQLVAFVEFQVSVELPPLDTEVGLAVRVTVGADAVTVTVVDCAAEPPAPAQVSVYSVDALSAPVLREPLVTSLPLHPPEAAQEVAFVVDQFNVELLPLMIELGFAERATVGGGVPAVTETVVAWVALPPAPLQVSV
jgi:hypothetical protein